MTNVPNQVKTAAEKARVLAEQAVAAMRGEAPPEEQPAASAPPGQATSAAEADEFAAGLLSDLESPGPSEALGDGNQPPPPPPKKTEPGDEGRTDWKGKYIAAFEKGQAATHKLAVLQGKYDAEVPRLAQQVKALEQRLAGVADDQTSSDAGSVPSLPPELQKLVDGIGEKYEDEELGASVAQLAMAAARSVSKPENAADKAKIEALEARVAQLDQVSKDAQLAALVKDYPQINEDPEFNAWLDLADPFSGRTRIDLINEAWQAGDVARTAHFFITWKEQQSSADKPAKPRIPEKLAVPDETGKGGHDAPPKPMLRLSNLKKLEGLAREGHFRGKDAQLKTLRDAFTLAAAEGRLDESR